MLTLKGDSEGHFRVIAASPGILSNWSALKHDGFLSAGKVRKGPLFADRIAEGITEENSRST